MSAGHTSQFGITAQPRELAFGVLARRDDRLARAPLPNRTGRRDTPTTADSRRPASRAGRSADRRARAAARLPQRNRAPPSRRSAARFAPPGRPYSRGRARAHDSAVLLASAGLLQRADRLAGQRVHLERSLDALPVARRDPRGRGRVHAPQALVQCVPAKLRRFAIELGTDGLIGARQRREAVAQSAQIEQCAADQQRQSAARADLRDRARGILREASRRVRLRGLEDVDEVVRHRSAGRRGGFRRTDVEAAIDHRRIHADDLERYALARGASARSVLPHAVGPVMQTHSTPAVSLTSYWPRRNSRSRSSSVTRVHVGRP